jgi:hypothetical protein
MLNVFEDMNTYGRVEGVIGKWDCVTIEVLDTKIGNSTGLYRTDPRTGDFDSGERLAASVFMKLQ